MQAPHPPEKKTPQKNKVWAKKTLKKKKKGNQWIFWGAVGKIWAARKNVNLSSLQCKSGDVKMVIRQCEVVNLGRCN